MSSPRDIEYDDASDATTHNRRPAPEPDETTEVRRGSFPARIVAVVALLTATLTGGILYKKGMLPGFGGSSAATAAVPSADDPDFQHKVVDWANGADETLRAYKEDFEPALNKVLAAQTDRIAALEAKIQLLETRTSATMSANRDSLSPSAQLRVAIYAAGIVLIMAILGLLVRYAYTRRKNGGVPDSA